jgi:hypothetical protein
MARNGHELIRAFVIAGLLATSGAAVADQAAPKEGTFEGTWNVQGTIEPVRMGAVTMTVARVEGKVSLRSGDGLAREFSAVCNMVSDEATGGVGRCTWTDAAGDALVLEMSGEIIGPAGTSREGKGKVVGGTGRYAGVEGEIHLDWLFVESSLDDHRFKGYVTELKGSWKRP